MNETTLTLVGNLTADPELRQTQSGVAVASFTVASTPRNFDRAANEWKDGEALFLRCSAWRDLATNITASLTKGSRVIVTGRLQQRSYQDREGNSRVSMELQVDEVGPSLRYATAQVVRGDRSGGASFGGDQRSDAGAPRPPVATGEPQQASDAEWATTDATPF
ncbi:single-stranded DNA-binding protein [Microbacterium sp. CH12i]|uniref:single-stranded DNA-binding protein n=1 Tax=Microbacterium sp. CH12i TaxID=1479651 RepID=UPI00046201C7|nr:single-stranded DNA-binding protein [Microbacterium sp. CH12i]KDA04733.1 single-stranded DNA-binding protein [Microbacterium sp. CH12i]